MPTIELLKALLFESVAKLYANDAFLFMSRGLENACVARIIYYMQDILNTDLRFHVLHDYDIDYEYNKSTDGLKRTRYNSNYIKPDLILHIRGTDAHNLMVVEFKKSRKCSDNDILKLQDLTDTHQRYKYALGCAVELAKHGARYQFFCNGEFVEEIDNNITRRKTK